MLHDKIGISHPISARTHITTFLENNIVQILASFMKIYVMRGSNKSFCSKAVHTTNDSVVSLVNIYGGR